MTNNNYSYDCPICGKSLSSGDIVVCPDCGAPYHRDCYLKEGRCIFPELHERGEDWQPPLKPEEKTDGQAELRCPRCGTLNPSYGLFCQVCGAELNKPSEQDLYPQQGGYPPQQGGYPPPNMFNGADIPLNSYTTPFGGVSPDEDIDGVSAKELAIFVGRNSHYYLPNFKAIASSRAKTINWASFIFTGGHFIYRKMYLYGIIELIIELILAIPNALILYNTLSTGVVPEFGGAGLGNLQTISTANMICSFIGIGLRLLCGMFANTLYKRHAYKKIARIKSKGLESNLYYGELARKGSVATKLILGLLIAYIVINFASMYVVMMFGV